jgi:hypothetical protein
VEAFADVLETSVEAEQKSLEALTSDQTEQVALVAKLDGVPAGTCLLVRSELDPCHPVSPWLAGLYVALEHRRQGWEKSSLELLRTKHGNEVIAVYISIQTAQSPTTNDWVGPLSIGSIGRGLRQL